MKNKKYKYSAFTLLTALLITISFSCEREFERMIPADFPSDGNVFIDGFSAGLAYEAWGDVKAFEVDNQVKYKGASSMRFAVPDEGQTGGFAGGRFVTSIPRDLSGYDALTFYAKATKAAELDKLGFGNNAEGSKYQASLNAVKVNTNWKKFIIPIPDASKLTSESGLFYYSESPENGSGYTFWIDELKFEKLGTIAHQEPSILNGESKTNTAFNSVKIPITGIGYMANLPNGVNQSVEVAPSYFEFTSSDDNVADVDENGLVTVKSAGTAVIKANMSGLEAAGSLTVNSTGDFVHAPEPTIGADSVISIFSDAYTNFEVEYYNGYWQPYQTTLSADFEVNGNHVLNYTNLNFVGIQFTAPTINASEMTHLHLDIFIPNPVDPLDKLGIKVVDLGADGSFDAPNAEVAYTLEGAEMVSNQWISIDIDLSALATNSNLAQIIFENMGSPLTGFYADNIYLYNSGGNAGSGGPLEAAPTPTHDAANVLSVYGDEYTNLEGTDYPDWGQSTVVSEEIIEGNNTLKFAGLNYQGIQLAASQDVSGMEFLHIDYWTDNSTTLNAFLISSGPVEKGKTLEVPTTGWKSVDIPLSEFSPVDLADIIQFKFDGNGDVYLDNIYFYKSGDGTTEAPTEAAPVPNQNADNVVSIYSDAYTNIAETNFNPDWGQSTVYSEVAVAGNNTMLYTSFNYQGIDFNTKKFDATDMTHFHMDIWTPNDVIDKVFTIKCVDFGGGNAEASSFILTVTHTDNGNVPALASGSWVSIDVPIADFSGDLTRTDLAQIVTSGSLTDVYIDNVYFYKSGGGTATAPTAAAPTPTQNANDVISVYSDAYTNISGTDLNPGWGQSTVYSEVSVDGNNAMLYSGLNYQGIVLGSSQDVSGMTYLHIDYWTANSSALNAFLISTGPVEKAKALTVPSSGWASIDIPLSDFSPVDLKDAIQLKFDGNGDVYIDNIYFHTPVGPPATEPTAAAPNPTIVADSVLSIFSDFYTNIEGTDFDPDWGQSTDVTTVDIAGNEMLKYAIFNYQGTVLGSAQDVSGMDYLHVDLWTADATDVKVTPINASGSPTENLVPLIPINAGQWNSYDVPLSEFTNSGMALNEIIQLKFDGQGGVSPSNIWLDNIYFYKDGGGSEITCDPGTEGEFISNGGFETGDNSCWLFFDNGGTIEVTDAENNGGSYSAKITTAPQKNPGIKKERFGVGTIQPNQKIEVKLDSKVESLVDGAVVNVLAFSESSTEGVAAVLHNLGTINVTPGSWNSNTLNFTTAADVSGGVSLLIEVVCGGAASCSGVVYFDNVSVKIGN